MYIINIINNIIIFIIFIINPVFTDTRAVRTPLQWKRASRATPSCSTHRRLGLLAI
jgi:hypothetical protein